MTLTTKKILDAIKKKGYPVSENSINLIGIRHAKNTDNLFSDKFAVIIAIDGKHEAHIYQASTDCESNAHLPVGFYKDCWALGAYMGRYTTLITADKFGINLCHGEADPHTLKKQHWLGGTQVIKDKADFHAVLDLIIKASDKAAPTFNYAILEESDFA